MTVYDPDNPLLRSIEAVAVDLHWASLHTLRSRDGERLTFSWLPTLKHGILYYDEITAEWGQHDPSEEEENLLLEFSSNGAAHIRQGDDPDVVYLETTFRAGDELAEFKEFLESSKHHQIGSSAMIQHSLKDLIEVFLFIPQANEPGLIPLASPGFFTRHPDVAFQVDCNFGIIDFDAGVDEVYWDLGQFLDDKKLRTSLPNPEPLHDGDLFFDQRGLPLYAGMLRQASDSHVGVSPAIVIRAKPKVSIMWLSDYLEYATESDGMLEGLIANWKTLNAWLPSQKITLPATKRDQIACAVTQRWARMTYMRRVSQLVQLREPINNIVPLYRQRTRAVDALHGELLGDLEAMQQPLPFFLEYPYRHYRHEDDPLLKTRAGQRLLGVLAKVPLYLAIEELLQAEIPLGKEMLAKVEERPLSDGALVDLQRELGIRLAECGAAKLTIFARLLPFLGDTSRLEAVVAARNRMHHEPYDDEGFLKVLDQEAPKLIELLRSSLRGCRFIVPECSKVTERGKEVIAEDICSPDAHFRKATVVVSLPLEKFPSETLLVWRNNPEHVIQLGRLITSKLVTRQTRDFGVFDRMQNSQRHFTFLRSE